jgi:hypothetical protein
MAAHLSVPVEIELPGTSTPDGAVKVMAVVLAAVARGEISPAQGKELAEVIDIHRQGSRSALITRLSTTGRRKLQISATWRDGDLGHVRVTVFTVGSS